MNRFARLCFVFFLGFSSAQAVPLAPEHAPEPLKPWIDWVLHDSPEHGCPFLYNSFDEKHCGWPTELALDLGDRRGTFSLRGSVFRDNWILLPGDDRHWPQAVTLNDNPMEVINRNGLPALKLDNAGPEPKAYRIKGEFFWDAMPETLAVPADTGLVSLNVNGSPVPYPVFRDGQIWVSAPEQRPGKPAGVENKVVLQVFRRIVDEVPLELITRLVLDVSGEPRELKLAVPLPEGFIPLHLSSPLPARLEDGGRLLLQLRPGRWQIDLAYRSAGPVEALPFQAPAVADKQEAAWPDSEIWVFDARPALRVVEIEQVGAVDANLTNLPDDWQAWPAYRVEFGQTMQFKVIRRGDPEPEPSRLNLTRKLWLDFDGAGYTVNDTISGRMTRGWRLNALPELKLGKVALDGSDQLITRLEGSGKEGVEVRRGIISLEADSRLTGAISEISAVGWEQSFQQVSAELNLPPGWRLLAAGGVDNVPDTWVARWTLLDLFLVLVSALAVYKLWTPLWGGIALAALALIWHEAGAPHYVWLHLLAATALIRVLPEGRFLQFVHWYRRISWLGLILIAVPFMIDQVRIGLYPQLERPWQSLSAPPYPAAAQMPAAPEAAAMHEEREPPRMFSKSRVADAAGSVAEGMGYLENKPADVERVDPNAKIQTGPGLPAWQWHRVLLTWNGSVDPGQALTLWYLPPGLTLALNFLRVALIAVLALLMFGVAEKWIIRFKGSPALIFWCLLMPVLSLPSEPAHADFPGQAVLDQLKARLLEAPDCLPACAESSAMQVKFDGEALQLSLDMHAAQGVAVPLPADDRQWFPNRVTVDGVPAPGLFRTGNNLWLHLDPGRHAVVLRGILPATGQFTLPLPLKPHRVTVEGSGWETVGIGENGLPGEQLRFERVQKAPGKTQAEVLTPGVLPAFVRIERTLQLGLDWQVTTRIVRLSEPGSPVLLSVPLLPGEAVTTPGVRVRNGKADVNMAAGQAEMAWVSTLAKSDTLELAAAPTDQWIEVFRADVSPVWHIETSGIPMIYLNHEQRWLPEWRPWPGEKIMLAVSRPQAAAGRTLTIDNSRLTMTPGKRIRDTELSLRLRSSQGGQHPLLLPEAAELQTVAIDGQPQPLRLEGRKLVLPVRPGTQTVTLRWLEAQPIAARVATPEVDLGAASVNAGLNIRLGEDRWVLWVDGPKMGPAVLFWGVLIVLALISIGLGRIPLTPLKHWQWFLLLAGLSQIPLPTALVVIAWLMLLGWRCGKSAAEIRYFNALQILLGGLTVLSLGILFAAVSQGLLNTPDMMITGNQSSPYALNWYQDRSAALLPKAAVVSVPLKVYRLLMLAWSLWLAAALLNWLKWGWGCFSSRGLWKKSPPKAARHEEQADAGHPE
ncbi:hypothetical protein [Candidatus Methylomicrobium oryzae]|uniref:hypothetical protein n=1 Tax=Candidatus Methylomicrobium oryzae TaxID=2802053 RepID=UPI0019219BAB|nr:hypothetical protein [Methylomicrobium sp. RS1]MBL1264779.1 hypothetical protein [Methylomicrobium sp. RS1]